MDEQTSTAKNTVRAVKSGLYPAETCAIYSIGNWMRANFVRLEMRRSMIITKTRHQLHPGCNMGWVKLISSIVEKASAPTLRFFEAQYAKKAES